MSKENQRDVEQDEAEVLSVNLETDPMEKITKFCLARMADLHVLMEMEPRLCDEVSAGVVAEFKFRGDKASVQKQLMALINYRTQVPYGEHDRMQLIKERVAYLDYVKELESNPRQMEIKRLRKDRLFDNKIEIEERIIQIEKSEKKLHLMLHEKGECLCVNNV